MTLDVPVPGSKSMTQRALVMAALASRPLEIRGALPCDDSRHLTALLGALGASVAWDADTARVRPGPLRGTGEPLYCGNGGTTLRFGSCLALVTDGPLWLDGDARMRERPVGPLGDALERLGVRVGYPVRQGFPPLRLERTGPAPAEVTVDTSLSSQFASGLLLAAPALGRPLTVRLAGDLVSEPYLEMTVRMMERAGIRLERPDTRTIRVFPGDYAAGAAGGFTVEPDWSSASFVLAAGFVSGRPVRVPGLLSPGESLQGDAAFGGMLKALSTEADPAFDLARTPDLIAPLAACALYARGPVRIRGAKHTRIKECDRIAVLAAAFRQLGANITEHADGLDLHPFAAPPAVDATLDDAGDHRMAMAYGVLSLRSPGVRAANPGCVSKSFPGFWETLARIRAAGPLRGPVLIGMRGAGKTEIGRRLASATGLRFVDADAELERRAGLDIPRVFERHGEAGFREREHALLLELLGEPGTVLATGGGAVLHAKVREALRERFTVWLHADPAILAQRVRGSGRPSLTGEPPEAELPNVFALREPLYRECARMRVDTSVAGPGEAAEKIGRAWGREGDDRARERNPKGQEGFKDD
ncbi:MAG: 3-phosphoshikimate 1-carboxyvinyltransferase [Acidobacteria bacterium]|nr:3-phosphoshikimate 1-carboxyvinyltransferase [Acidobacteriota bacterium]